MAKLVVTAPGAAPREVPLDKERITIGRRDDNDVRLEDGATSGHHATIITVLNDSFLQDLNSTNGTFVNGKRIQKHALRTGDIITIGRTRLEYLGDDAGAEDDFEKTMVLKPEALASAGIAIPKLAEPTPAATAGTGQLGCLQVVEGPHKGKELKLSKVLNTIGQPGVQLAAVTRRGAGYFIVHVGAAGPGARPAKVNGEPISTQARPLRENDIVELLGVKMRFYLSSVG
ncbi:MAG TPA: FHA domain-containing protein [Nevskiales bacterium]|nr:FHA domain-containing protein [Nevskiales bacterium]